MWNKKEICEFERLTKPVRFRTVKRVVMVIKSLQDRILPLLAKIGFVKEFQYEDETQNVLFNHYVGGFSYINEPFILATVEISVTEIHHVYQHYFYRYKGILGKKGTQGEKVYLGTKVNEDERSLRLVGSLRDIRIKVGKGYERIDNLEHKKVKIYNLDEDYKFDFTALRAKSVERMIYAPYGAVDEEELLNMMDMMCNTLREELKNFYVASCVVINKPIPSV